MDEHRAEGRIVVEKEISEEERARILAVSWLKGCVPIQGDRFYNIINIVYYINARVGGEVFTRKGKQASRVQGWCVGSPGGKRSPITRGSACSMQNRGSIESRVRCIN